MGISNCPFAIKIATRNDNGKIFFRGESYGEARMDEERVPGRDPGTVKGIR